MTCVIIVIIRISIIFNSIGTIIKQLYIYIYIYTYIYNVLCYVIV